MSTETRKELIKEAEGRLEFAIMLSIFFPTMIYALFRSVNETDQKASEMVLSWSLITVGYLVSFCVLKLCKNQAKDFFVKATNILSLVGIASFVFPIYYLAVYKNIITKSFAGYSFAPSLWLLLLTSASVLLLSCVFFCIFVFEWCSQRYKNKKK